MGNCLFLRRGAPPSSGPPKGKTLNEYTWEEISYISSNGLAGEYGFQVGDAKEIILNGTVGGLTLDNYSTYAFIIGINHNAAVEGNNLIHFQFGKTALSGGTNICFVDSGYNNSKTSGSWFNMNNSNTNSGGWENSRMRTVICPAFKYIMPSDLRAVLKTVTKYSDNTGGGSDTASYVTATTDNIFLLATYEVFGSTSYTNSAERNYQARYQYYKNGNSNVKYKHSSTSSNAYSWLRSVCVNISTGFCRSQSSSSSSGASYSLGFAPAFCV